GLISDPKAVFWKGGPLLKRTPMYGLQLLGLPSRAGDYICMDCSAGASAGTKQFENSSAGVYLLWDLGCRGLLTIAGIAMLGLGPTILIFPELGLPVAGTPLLGLAAVEL
ncbi:expressed unknown protein (Partial), partial [Seminavis robusta]